MWLVLLAAAVSAAAWVADMKASHIPLREERPVQDFYPEPYRAHVMSRSLDR
jgi:hypothetical protein